jgi:hypothetical protein
MVIFEGGGMGDVRRNAAKNPANKSILARIIKFLYIC